MSGRLSRRRTWLLLLIGTVATLLVVGVVAISSLPSRPTGPDHAAAPSTTSRSASATGTSSVAPSPGGRPSSAERTDAFGVQSNAILAENARTGSPEWRITDVPPTGYVQGWANLTSAQVGESVTLYVSTTAEQFHVTAYRMGYYGGAGARAVWSSSTITGRVQPPCPVLNPVTINMVSCDNWTPSLTMPVTPAFMQGDYLLKFVGANGEQSFAPLTIWDPSSTATYLFETHDLTNAAWNEYGGFSFYSGKGACPPGAPSYPVCNRARVASFDRPYTDGHGSGDFLYNEYPLLEFMEQHGLDVAYVSDVALDGNPDVMLHHKAFLSLGHDETWTYAERQGVVAAAEKGVNIAFFSAAAIVRHARLQPSSIGPDREVVEYRDSNEDPVKNNPKLTTGNTWAVAPTYWSPNAFIGQQYSGYLHPGAPNAPFVVHDAAAWIFNGTGLHNGATIPGIISSDIDHLDPASTPANLQVLGHSPVPLKDALTNQGTWGNTTYSDMTYYAQGRSDAGIFDSGAVSWIVALSKCAGPADCPATAVGQMTANLLRLFGQGPAGKVQPPAPNWRQITPAGS